MSALDLHLLVGKLDLTLSGSLEAAAARAVRESHPSIELEHWLSAALDNKSVAELLQSAGADVFGAQQELARAIMQLERVSTDGAPSMAPQVISLAREAWTQASLGLGLTGVTAPVFFLTLVSDTELRAATRRVAPALLHLNRAYLEEQSQSEKPQAAAPATQPAAGSEDFLAAYTVDMTEEARNGTIDAVVGRDLELRQMIDILMRRRQNNPILVGEAGVGKTAIVEAFAIMIAQGDAPEKLNKVSVHALDLSLLQAGAGVKGEFERRLKGLIDQVKASPTPVILFVDEAHTLVGAGAASGQGDAANILKPALARGEIRTIAATTWSEYKKYFEKDPALTRRFQTIKVDEPDIETAVRMIRTLAPKFRDHHGVPIRDSAVRAAVELSARYLPERQLPDKAVSLIDTAASAVAMSRQITPEALAAERREAAFLQAEIDALELEPASPALPKRMKQLAQALKAANDRGDRIEAKLEKQQQLADEADAVEQDPSDDARKKLGEAERKLARAAGEAPLLHRVVDAEAVAEVVARWTGVPVGRLMQGQIDAVVGLSDLLSDRILGQDHAVDVLAEAMRVSRAGLLDERKPRGVFLMVGTSGVGKTETALALADALYGGSSGLTVINMSEFKEEHKVSLLMGSPPGYVGYGEGGVLTEAVRRRPYSVLLLDEMDKAHPGVQDLFYQVFDKGVLRDGEGRDVDFRNTTIIMTANTGTDTLSTLAEDPDTMPSGAALAKVLKPELLETFKPAFLGRVSILPYLPLGREVLSGIVDLQIARIAARVAGEYSASLNISDLARQSIVDRAEAGDTGARAIEAMLSQELLPRLADFFLNSVASGRLPRAVDVDVDAEGFLTVSAVGPRRRQVS